MGTNGSKFWLGLGLGSIIGVVAYRFSCSAKGEMLKEKVCHAFHRMGNKAEDMIDAAKDKVADAGTIMADKVAHGALNIAEKADDVKNKVHSFVDSVKR